MTMSADIPPYRILVVDDNPRERVAIRGSIEDEIPDCVVCEAEDVEEARQVLESEEPFDLVIVDLRMNNADEGLELLGRKGAIYRRYAQTRVIMLTAHPTVESASKACEAHADAYISKLWEDSTKKLMEKVRELLEQREEREDMWRQVEGQRKADEAFLAHRAEWSRKYAGRFLAVQNGEVVLVKQNHREFWDALDNMPHEQRLDVGIVEVPQGGLHNANG